MAKKYNPGTINLEAATDSILSDGGNKKEIYREDGTKHTVVYSTKESRHLSYDTDPEGNISNVHTDKDNHAYMDYKDGK